MGLLCLTFNTWLCFVDVKTILGRLTNVGRVSVGTPAKEYAMSDQKKGTKKSMGPNKNNVFGYVV